MNAPRSLFRLAGLSAALLLPSTVPAADDFKAATALAATLDNGDAEWEKVVDLLAKPADYFNVQRPATREEFQLAVKEFEQLSLAAANAARDFQEKFPGSRLRDEARLGEMEMLASVVRFGGSKETLARLLAVEDTLLADAKAPVEQKYMVEIRRAMERIDQAANTAGDELATAEKVLAPLFERYPAFTDTYTLLLGAAENAAPQRGLEVAKRVAADEKAPEEARAQASGMVAGLEAVGKPLALAFTALDGREVDLAKMTNKVVLVDFWATWCGPCVKEIPRMLKLYEDHHAKGFEIVGISLDESKADLEAFVAKKKLPWPHSFEGRGWKSLLAKQYGVNSIPRMWLVNKKGLVVSTDARENLEEEVATLLAE